MEIKHWIMVAVGLIGSTLLIATKNGWKPWSKKKPALQTTATSPSPTVKKWWEKIKDVKLEPILWTAGVVIVAVAIWQFVEWRARVEAENERIAFQEAVQKEQEQKDLARKLRSGIIMPEKDTVFTLTATEHDKRIFIVRPGYCTRTEPANPSHGYSFVTQLGRWLVLPGKEVDMVGPVEHFSVSAFGSPTSEVRVWVYSKDAAGKCKPPKRDSA